MNQQDKQIASSWRKRVGLIKRSNSSQKKAEKLQKKAKGILHKAEVMNCMAILLFDKIDMMKEISTEQNKQAAEVEVIRARASMMEAEGKTIAAKAGEYRAKAEKLHAAAELSWANDAFKMFPQSHMTWRPGGTDYDCKMNGKVFNGAKRSLYIE